MTTPYMDILTDYFLEKGSKGLFNYAKDFTAFYRTNIYSVLWGFLKGFGSYLTPLMPLKDIYFQAPWFYDDLTNLHKSKELYHPFYALKQRAIPGKKKQISDLYEVFEILSCNIRTPGNYTFYPFLTQPMMELALSIPTYHLFHKTYDRYPLRKAIADKLKTSLHMWRRDKGEFSNINMLGLKKNYAYVTSLLLEGQTVSKGYANKNILEDVLKETISGNSDYQWPLLRLVAAEMFLSYWKE